MPDSRPAHRFHHLGYATRSIARALRMHNSLGYRQESAGFEDPGQGVAGLFVIGAGPRIELLENLPGSDTLTPWIDAGIKVYHYAYETEDLIASLAAAREDRAKVIVEPVPAVAFNGRQIAFAMYRNGLLVEFIEAMASLQEA